MTSPANSLLGLLPNQWLSSWFGAWSRQQDLFTESPISIWLDSNNSGHYIGPFLLLLCLLRWVSWTLLASDMLALSTSLISPERSVASVTRSVYAHPNWLLDAICLFVRAGRQWLNAHRETLSQLSCTIGLDLGTHDLGGLWSFRDGLDWFRGSDRCWLRGFGHAVWSVDFLEKSEDNITHLGPAVAVAGFAENDNRFEPSLLFNTVFILETILLNPPFFSPGTPGPSFAGALIAESLRRSIVGCGSNVLFIASSIKSQPHASVSWRLL